MKYLLFLILAWGYTVAMVAPSSVANEPVASAFYPLPYDGDRVTVSISPDATKIAVMKNGDLHSRDFVGTALEVWSLDKNSKPIKLVYSDNRDVNFSARTMWVGSYLLYSTFQENNRVTTDQDFAENPMSILKHMNGYIWMEGWQKAKEFPPAIELFKVQFPHGDKILIINPVKEILSESRTLGVPMSIYSAPDAKLLKRIR